MQKDYDPDFPIIVGLAGKAATGKTSVAEKIVPKASFNIDNDNQSIIWDHIFFAMPIYELYSVRTFIEGINAESRKLYGIHDVLYDIYGSSAIGTIPDYDSFIDLVKKIYREPIDSIGNKPRTFLQKCGDYCRSYDEACFAKWGIRKANKLHMEYILGLTQDQEPKNHCVIISDVRFVNEAEAIKSQPNGMLVRFDASEEVRRSRIFDRDNIYMTEEQMSHRSEKEIDMFSDLVDVIIDSSSMSIDDQVAATVNSITERFGINAKN